MATRRINASLSDAELKSLKDDLAAWLKRLPFIVNLTPEERRSTVKAGPNSLSFVENALAASENNPTILPGTFNTADFKDSIRLFAGITELNTAVASVGSQLDDTRMAAGGDAMQMAIQVYNYVKAAAKITPGLKPVEDQLSERFQKTTHAKQTPKP